MALLSGRKRVLADWVKWRVEDGWDEKARALDLVATCDQQALGWGELRKTQRQALQLADTLATALLRVDPLDRESVTALGMFAKSVLLLTEIRSSALDGLTKPEPVCAEAVQLSLLGDVEVAYLEVREQTS